MWTSYRPYRAHLESILDSNAIGQRNHKVEPKSLPLPVEKLDLDADDAFATIMQWLFSRINATR